MNFGIPVEKAPKLEARGFEKCLCNELEEKLRESEAKCTELGLEIQKIKGDNEILVTVLKEEKSAIEDELKVLKMEKRSKPRYGGEEHEKEDEILQLGIEIKKLECEKKMDEKEVEIWKQKLNELELKLNQNQDLGKEAQEELGTPYNGTPYKRFHSIEEDKLGAKRVTRKMLFKEDGDGGDEHDLVDIEIHSLNDQGYRNCGFSNDCAMEGTEVGNIKPREIDNMGDEQEVDDCEEDVQVVSTFKRKRALNVVTSDTESDADDNVPISQLLGIRPLAATPNQTSSKVKGCSPVSSDEVDDLRDTIACTRRRLVSLRQKSRKVAETKEDQVISGSEDDQDGNSAEGSDDESDGLSDFIDDDDSPKELEDDLDSGDENDTEIQSDSRDDSDSEDSSPDYPNWECIGEMQAALGNDSTLCMKGICAINRRDIAKRKAYGATFYPHGWDSGMLDDASSQEISEEEAPRPTSYPHGQGFSQCDAPRGRKLAELYTKGDPKGDVKISVEELNKYDPEGGVCYDLAARYSRQLFEIYKNKEDPYYPHS